MTDCKDCNNTGIVIINGKKTRCWLCDNFKGYGGGRK